eukprot:TRINITY_DN5877_c0_g1_i1.p1 TRINITY_DN5877_c0_g1~~TRINITY_DN5877_c0_g1_i1.p1  ORF type:complete len:629 (+),score=163.02 TRINITY_DN5877_c0_g1_i1:37-1923(+)
MTEKPRRAWDNIPEGEVVALLTSIPRRSPWIVKWQLLSEYIRPYEPDWRSYTDKSKYDGKATLEVHPHLSKHGGQIKMTEGFLKLGFVKLSDAGTHFVLDHWQARERLERLKQEKKRKQGILGTSSKREKQHVTWHIPKEEPPPAWWNPDNSEVASLLSVSVSGEGASFCGTSTSGDGDMSEPAGGGTSASVPSDSEVAEFLKFQVRELTRQVRMLRAASLSNEPATPVTPFIMKGKHVAPTSGNYPVRLQLNYLDPDSAPYRVAIQLKSLNGYGWYSPPCSVIDHQYVVFLAPPNPPGSYPVTLCGTTETGQLKKYCQSTWLEYKSDDQFEARPDLTRKTISALHSPPSPRRKSESKERQSCIKGTRKGKTDRRSSIASGTSSALKETSLIPDNDGKPEVTLSLRGTREGLTHHQINELNALNIISTCNGEMTEGLDTFDPAASDFKSEMKSEFTSDIADTEEDKDREEDDEEVWQTRQFRALLPNHQDFDGVGEHPPLTKEMLELLTLGHGWNREELMRSCTTRSIATLKAASAVLPSKGTSGARSGGGSTSMRSMSPVNPPNQPATAADAASSPSSRPELSEHQGNNKENTISASSSSSSACSKKDKMQYTPPPSTPPSSNSPHS